VQINKKAFFNDQHLTGGGNWLINGAIGFVSGGYT
jgi:hypothetical protein